MTLYQAFETLVVPLIVLACALHVVGRYMPRTRERVKASLAAGLGGASAGAPLPVTMCWMGSVAIRLVLFV